MVFHAPRDVRVYGDQRPTFSESVLITETRHKVLTSGTTGAGAQVGSASFERAW